MKDLVKSSLLVSAIGIFTLGQTLSAQAYVWKIDPAHSSAQFSVRHMMLSNVRGGFSHITGTVDYDGKNISRAKVDADIDISTIDTGDTGRDKHLKSPDFFDVAKYPTMSFKSEKVEQATDGHFKLVGQLSLHGVTKQVTLDVDGPTPQIKDPHGNIKIGASASTKINRKDFGITEGGVLDNGGAMISDDIPITIDLEMVQANQPISLK